VPRGGGRRTEGGGVGSAVGPWSGWLWAALSEAAACARGEGGLANTGRRRGMDATDKRDRAATGPDGWKAFEISFNFPYRNFSRFEMFFELKFKEVSV
jgi:hypothetical protein